MQVVINDLIVNYEIYKNSTTDKYLVILPGWMKTSTEWLNIAKTLGERYNVVIIDFPGFGLSSRSLKDFDTYDYSNFVKDFLTKLKISKCILLGHSFGGRVAIILSSTTTLVENLILVSSAGLKTTEVTVIIKRLLFLPVKLLRKTLPKSVGIRLSRLFGSADYRNSGEMRKSFVKIVNQNLDNLLNQIKVQTLIVWGDKDDQLNVKQTKIFKKEIKNSLIRIVWGAGHNPHIEKPDVFLKILEEYLC